MWALYSTLRLTEEGGNEREALEVWRRLGLEDAFGEPKECKEIVKLADDMASTSDMWITNFSFAGVSEVFEHDQLYNMFNPKLSTRIRQLERQKLEDFLKRLADKLKNFATDPRKVYHALYALYEVEWAAHELPPSLADTRIPTHMLFDHAYATALTLNLLWPDGKVGGYAVLVDIPGIQQIVGSARKAGDFWAGSWMISAIIWLTLCPFVWELGADTLLKPSPRYNPYYHATLCAQLGNNLWSSFGNLYSSFHPGKSQNFNFELHHAVRQPVIPGTACLILPKVRSNGQKLEKNSLEREVREKFEKAFEFILTIASGEKAVSEEPYAAFFKLLSKASSTELDTKPVVKLFRIVRDNEPKA